MRSAFLVAMMLVSASVFAAGLEKGAGVTPYQPTHLAGPDKGTTQCPPCKYGQGPLVQIFVNGDDEKNVAGVAAKLEKMVAAHGGKVYGVVIVTSAAQKESAAKWATDLKIEKSAMATGDDKIAKQYQIGDAKNVVLISNKGKVEAKFENLMEADFSKIEDAVKAL